jgi:hypothetical protein
MLRKLLKANAGDLVLIGLSAGLKKIFRLNGLDFLLGTERYEEPPQEMPAGLTAAEPQQGIPNAALSSFLGQIGPRI